MKPGFFFLLLAAVALIAAPIAAGAFEIPLGGFSSALLTATGVGLFLFFAVLMVITNMYHRTQPAEAIVRTGMGGMAVVVDGGIIVVPVVHEVSRVSLSTKKLVVRRDAENALLTGDKLRADVHAEFFVRVQPQAEDIKAAARTIGTMDRTEGLTTLIEDKLVSALRNVAAQRTLEELNSKREEFVKGVTEILTPDLRHNGLTLESVTISRLDQTDVRHLRDDNILDAQGKRTIAQITEDMRTQRNVIEREAEKKRKQQDVETRQDILKLEQTQAEAVANQKAQIAKVEADKDAEARRSVIEAERSVQLVDIQKEEALLVANQKREQAAEVATREKEAKIAEAEKARAAAEASLATAEAEREAARQSIRTVEVQAQAERDRKVQVIQAEAEAQRAYVAAERAADASAYGITKQAEGARTAAEAEAEAITKRAAAEASAVKARAEARLVEEMIPVNVERERVAVETTRVAEVLVRELEAREQHGRAAQEFELGKLRIEKAAEVQIAVATAMGVLTGKFNLQLFGTPEDAGKMLDNVRRGMGAASTLDGFLDNLGPTGKLLLAGVGAEAKAFAEALATRLNMTPVDAKKLVDELLAQRGKLSENGPTAAD